MKSAVFLLSYWLRHNFFFHNPFYVNFIPSIPVGVGHLCIVIIKLSLPEMQFCCIALYFLGSSNNSFLYLLIFYMTSFPRKRASHYRVGVPSSCRTTPTQGIRRTEECRCYLLHELSSSAAVHDPSHPKQGIER